ncbi:transcription-repair coupling factor (superfamily II helicase) [Allocatelliglobosispora scoriae]|uniref:Transcription-repair-coupling factor n=1 Tax=Allocatelliglobosispora scoriae TaxID=643052 RepID=A0A841BY09_9ACTN|nr:transcription-repair coupling factor [Allocatelliglobosispora scoriae]MBB5871610.1 transcription-repair coupling factor (superfamily II helicase) [Allocatelliglobosispora scoriae]
MRLSGLLDAALADPALTRTRRFAGDNLDVTAPPSLRPFLAAVAASERTVLAVTATSREADDLADTLGMLLDPGVVAAYPSWETLPHERLSPRSDTVGKRLAVLRRLAHPGERGPLRVVVAPVRSLLQPQLVGLGDLTPVELRPGQTAPLERVAHDLVDLAYARVDLVTKRGEFAVRGGLLDVFPPTEEHPLRVEFWGDEVEEIRSFAVADQRTIAAADSVYAPPCRELLLTPAVRARAAEVLADHPEIAEILDKLVEGIPVEGMESLAPTLAGPNSMQLLVECLPKDTIVLLCDPERIRTRAHDLVRTSEEFLQASWAAAAVGGKAPVDVGSASFKTLAEVRTSALNRGQSWWTVSPFGLDAPSAKADDTPWLDPIDVGPIDEDSTVLTLGAQAAPLYHGDTEKLIADLRGWLSEGWRVALVFAGHGPAQRSAEVLRDAGIGATLTDEPVFTPGSLVVTTGSLLGGLVDPEVKLAVITGDDISGGRGTSTKDMRKMPSRRRNTIDPLELRAGDFVVHEQHGIGRYVELVQRKVNGADREYIVIEYAASKRGQPGDRLFVPTDALDQLSRYVGGEAPTLHKMGGSEWSKAKARARKAVREIAAQLIQLYAARTSAKGHAFGPDTPWQRELEDAFPFTETPDQLSAIEEVKEDMEKPMPMDRLICGDVGYGKTEIAVRAAFKAVQDGKQVAILVPTTLLAQQHFNTFSERMAQFPVQIKQLSRFQTPSEAARTIEMAGEGTADIVIGTHRLLQQATRFKQLGLVIVDEEQRFGVEHKEHLKSLRTNVDVLTMSATPIPRTLEMAITGIREMSTIATPPEERHPVLTYVGAYDDKTVAAAIHRELLRDGQVFYLHNRVESIDRTAQRLRQLVPEARIVTAHGQMGEDALEKVMVGFWEKEFDVLVATTIIESGIDIPNANTLILERADLLGLSQLHQIRGRVGRGRERAYAYFLYPPEKPLTEHAHERLATIAQHTELGAGMYVAMKDLEIRGAGNLLGGEQSGHIEGVGFDLYVRMVGDAVRAFKNNPADDADEAEAVEVKIDLPVDAHLPVTYVEVERLRLEMYRKLASARTHEELDAVVAELTDRYGEPPAEVVNLVSVARFRLVAKDYGLSEVGLQGKHIRFSPLVLPDSRQMRLKRYHPDAVYKPASSQVSIPHPMTRRIGGEPLRDQALLDWCAQTIKDILG